MKLVEVADFGNVPYANNDEKQKHLFRMQAAKCQEMNLFILKLAKNFPEWWANTGKGVWTDYPMQEWERCNTDSFNRGASHWFNTLPNLGSVHQVFKTKYDAIMKAKREFQNAGGEYPPME